MTIVKTAKGEADIPEDRLKYAEVMYVEIYLNKKKKKKKTTKMWCIHVHERDVFSPLYEAWGSPKSGGGGGTNFP